MVGAFKKIVDNYQGCPCLEGKGPRAIGIIKCGLRKRLKVLQREEATALEERKREKKRVAKLDKAKAQTKLHRLL